MAETEQGEAKELARARAKAVRLLGPAPLTARQLTDRLRRRGFEAEVVTTVVTECVESGWVDDADYARRWLERRREQGYGRARIRAELIQRGIEEEVAAAALAEEEVGAELAAARRAGARKIRSLGTIRDDRDRAKLARFLAARGFNGHTARRIVEEVGEASGRE
jgi:Uncharacterized protein conserved in bacteria